MNSMVLKKLHNGKKNLLWGAGKNGIDVLFSLIHLGVHVDAFCDIDVNKQGIRLFNKLVVSPQEVLKSVEDYNVIITTTIGNYRNDIIKTLVDNGCDDYLLFEDIDRPIAQMNVNRTYLYRLILDSYTKKIFVYGMSEETRKIIQLLEMLDVAIDKIFSDTVERYQWKNYEIRPYYELLDEEKGTYVVVIISREVQYKRLEELGLELRKDFNFMYEYEYGVGTYVKEIILDPHLGYSYMCNRCIYPGMVEVANYNSKFLICTLGGSTTDCVTISYKSWSEFLAEKLKERGVPARVICAGVSGYKSSQELIKFMRDVKWLAPDLIIQYTGINDAWQNVQRNHEFDKTPFIHHYQIMLMEEMSKRMKESKFTLGIESKRQRWDIFTDNIKMMQAITGTYNITYIPFLQPCLITKKSHSLRERELIINTEMNGLYSNYVEEFYGAKEFETVPALHDMTRVFDDTDDVYLDMCHVTEKGNEIIAQYMADYIIDNGFIKEKGN